ncbi:oxidoreductase, partial [Candidatus Shapirobacteria bacterium CG10_big_fil_rev_8_21_14_0_10_38_14]
MRIAIIGTGITGLTAAFKLSQKGHQITIFEKENYLGGLAAGFKKKDWSWHLEYFFHHLFTSDKAAKKLITELDLSKKLFFQRPKTSIYFRGKIAPFDSLCSLLNFPFLSFPQKIRTGLTTAYLRLTNNWQKLEKTTASQWLSKFYGQKVYQILWEPLLTGKFGEQKNQISMAWFWARIKKRSSRL